MTELRDTFADETHFLDHIAAVEASRQQSLERMRQRKAAGTFTERRPGISFHTRWVRRQEILECHYSLGLSIEELRPEFSSLVDELPGLEAFDASTGGSVDASVTLCSWAVLLDDQPSAEKLAQVLERDGAFRTRTAALLAYFDIHPAADDPRNPMEDYWIGRARAAVDNGDDQAAEEILYTFVNEEWFQNTYNSGLRVITHKGDKLGHVGYWCYEAAAFAKILGIDDGRLEDHKYYPWDLAHPE